MVIRSRANHLHVRACGRAGNRKPRSSDVSHRTTADWAGPDSRIRVRDETGARIPLFQKITRDRKKKDESGKDIDLKTGDIIQNSMVVPGAGGG